MCVFGVIIGARARAGERERERRAAALHTRRANARAKQQPPSRTHNPNAPTPPNTTHAPQKPVERRGVDVDVAPRGARKAAVRAAGADDVAAAFARKICFRCPVRIDCAQWAIKANEDYGVFGGASPRQRQKMKSLGTADVLDIMPKEKKNQSNLT